MKITVLMGSPFVDGNNDKLVRAFTKGALEAGHEVVRFNVADMDIEPCTKAYFDKIEAGEEADTEDMKKILTSILESQVVVFSTPLYYYGMTAQLKAVLDHFNSRREELMRQSKAAILLANCGGPALAIGLAVQPIEETGALEEAYKLGLNAAAQVR